MSRFPWLLLLLFIVVPPLGVFFFADFINTHYSEWEGCITALVFIVETYAFVFTLFYWRSERFYLWVQRQLLRIRKAHTYWRITARFENVHIMEGGVTPLSEIEGLIRPIYERSFPGSTSVFESGKNFTKVTVDDGDRFEITVNYDTKETTLTTSRMRVPSGVYLSYMGQLTSLLDGIEKVLKPDESFYRLAISFDRNPYFGFFVQNVPSNLVNAFHCSFQSTVSDRCAVEATKDTLSLSTVDCITLRDIATKYLGLSVSLIPEKS